MVGKTGVIVGDVFAQKLIISGKVVGAVEAKSVEIMAGGRLEGTLVSEELVIERKGIFLGQSKNANNAASQNGVKLLTPTTESKPVAKS